MKKWKSWNFNRLESEVHDELLEFLPKNKLSAFVTWLYEEIQRIKEERRQEDAKTPPKEKTKKEKKAKKSKKSHVVSLLMRLKITPVVFKAYLGSYVT